MTRKRQLSNKLPKQGDVYLVTYLPRDIWLGHSAKSPKGTLLYGWDTGSDTLQLWEIIEPGKEAKARFLGFICSRPQD